MNYKIKWPGSLQESVELYQGFLLELLRGSGIDYGMFPTDPVVFSVNSAAAPQDPTIRNSEISWWWKHIDDNGYIRDFQSEDSIKARLAIEVISAVPECVDDFDELSERLSWALQFTGALHVDEEFQHSLMLKYFKFK